MSWNTRVHHRAHCSQEQNWEPPAVQAQTQKPIAAQAQTRIWPSESRIKSLQNLHWTDQKKSNKHLNQPFELHYSRSDAVTQVTQPFTASQIREILYVHWLHNQLNLSAKLKWHHSFTKCTLKRPFNAMSPTTAQVFADKHAHWNYIHTWRHNAASSNFTQSSQIANNSRFSQCRHINTLFSS